MLSPKTMLENMWYTTPAIMKLQGGTPDVKRVISYIKMSVMKKEVQDYASEVWGGELSWRVKRRVSFFLLSTTYFIFA